VVRHVANRVGVLYLGRLVEEAPAQTLFSDPRHPYTRMLLDSVPDIDMTGRERVPIAGENPNPIAPPPGCHFHPRCPFAFERCRVEAPAFREVTPAHAAACHAVEEGRI
jgi:peptide/nickel transport system ATP-binding protein